MKSLLILFSLTGCIGLGLMVPEMEYVFVLGAVCTGTTVLYLSLKKAGRI